MSNADDGDKAAEVEPTHQLIMFYHHETDGSREAIR